MYQLHITLILYIVPTKLSSQENWDYPLSLSTKTETQQLFLPYLNLLLLIISSVLPLDEIFAFFDYEVIIYGIRKSI